MPLTPGTRLVPGKHGLRRVRVPVPALILALRLLANRAVADARPTSDAERAHRYFLEAEWACQDDGGKLWGRSLEGPMVFVEPGTRRYFASRRPPDPSTEGLQGVFTGTLPADIGIA